MKIVRAIKLDEFLQIQNAFYEFGLDECKNLERLLKVLVDHGTLLNNSGIGVDGEFGG